MRVLSSPAFRLLTACCAVSALCFASSGAVWADTGKLLLTGGVSSIEGAAGGGITPWAVIGSNATAGEVGISAFASRAVTTDYRLNIVGAAVGIQDRLELSIAQQDLNTGITGATLGLPGLHLKQTIVGAKVRVLGDAVLDSDTWVPQVAVGVQAKKLASSGLDGTFDALGVKRSGVDVYLSATKLLLGDGLLLNATLRATKANQNGLLGFGATLGGREDRYRLQPEFSMGYLVSKNLVIGAEYRFMRNRLTQAGAAAGLGTGFRAQDWKDVFIAWAPSKNLSLTMAYVDLGVVVPATTDSRRQKGAYVSVQAAF